MAVLSSAYLITVTYFGTLMNQFIITSDNCKPFFYLQNNGFCIGYDHCDMDQVIRIKDCPKAQNCQLAPANLHCGCLKTENIPEYAYLLQKCKEVDQNYINYTANGTLCPPGYIDRRSFCFDWACGPKEYIRINWCTVNMRCFLAPNVRSCSCGHVLEPRKSRESVFSSRCSDIDECLQDPCEAQEICTNTPGSYTCVNNTCIDQKQFNTKQCSLIHWDQQIQSPWYKFHGYCSVVNSIVALVNKQCQAQESEHIFQKIILTANVLLSNDSLWSNLKKEERFYLGSIFLRAVENSALVASLNLSDQGRRIKSTENIDLEIRTFRGKNASVPDRVKLQAKGNFIEIYRSAVTRKVTMGTDFAAVALIAFNNMDSVLNGSIFNLSTTGGEQTPFQLISNVVSAVTTNSGKLGFDPTVNFTLKHTEEAGVNSKLHCANWNYASGQSYWSPRGCVMGDSNGTHTQCRCSRLSSLALLITHFDWQTESAALSVITLVGISVSLVCLAIAIGIFVFVKQLKSAVTATHIQLCLSLFLAELLFIIGVNRTENRVLCGMIAGFLHYLFLAAFIWMFLEGVQLHLMVRNIRKLRIPNFESNAKYMYPFGYGVPAIIVIVSAAVYHDGYGSAKHCWLQLHRRFIWSFLGPVCVIIGINTFLFLITLWTLRNTVSKRDVAVSKLKDTRMLAFKAISQVFVLGCSWIFGLFHFKEETVVMAYLFTIINSFQGTFIFIILCVLNAKVRAQCQKWFSTVFQARRIVAPRNIVTNVSKVTSSEQ
ncbi:adhesion G protein-coupled receptor E3-like isoform X1 [Scyliorhinus canicula]|uniref:adhesion G protein-coupled receptor E3-like isoform X1 n=2 Tax=Scyliorhinus canicula TaxID=7830 RepID=UPI0018F54009|nr:adhesion G protein-coupled receptor E3-like isoform X1 [Scyliorhinus canicula]